MPLKTPLLTTGIKGLVGSRFEQDFADIYEYVNVPDITIAHEVTDLFLQSEARYVIHLAAYTNVSGAWQERGDTSGLAYQVNVTGTQNIVKACQQTDKHLIHISTAYVFNGDHPGLYTETDSVNPIEWYGQTKAEAEEIVRRSDIDWTILRIDQPFRSDPFDRLDVAHRIIQDIQQGTLRPQFTNHYFGPTFINDFAKVIDWVIRSNATGIYHASAGEKWNDFDFATFINQTHHLKGDIQPGDLNEYLRENHRPYQRNTALDCSKLLSQLDFELHTVKAAVAAIEI